MRFVSGRLVAPIPVITLGRVVVDVAVVAFIVSSVAVRLALLLDLGALDRRKFLALAGQIAPEIGHHLASLATGPRRETIDIAALEASLDAALLRNHLERKGFGPLLERVDAQFERLREWVVLPDAAPQDARIGFRQMVELHRRAVMLSRELKAAEAALAQHPSDENLKALNGICDQLY